MTSDMVQSRCPASGAWRTPSVAGGGRDGAHRFQMRGIFVGASCYGGAGQAWIRDAEMPKQPRLAPGPVQLRPAPIMFQRRGIFVGTGACYAHAGKQVGT